MVDPEIDPMISAPTPGIASDLDALDALDGDGSTNPDGPQAEPEGASVPSWEELLGSMFDVSNMLCENRAPLWVFTHGECGLMSNALAPLCAKWLGDAAVSDELKALIVVGPIVGARVVASVMQRKRAPRNAEAVQVNRDAPGEHPDEPPIQTHGDAEEPIRPAPFGS